MRIFITKADQKALRLHLPTGLILSRLSAACLSVSLKKKNTNISGKQLYTLFRAVKKYKKTHPQWKLVDGQTSDGEYFQIVL